MEKYCFVIVEKRNSKIEYLGLYNNERTARKAFLDFSKGLSKKICDERYSIIVFISELGCEQCVLEQKPSQMKWYQRGDKSE